MRGNKKCQSHEKRYVQKFKWREWKGRKKNLNLIDCKTNHTQKSINFIHFTYSPSSFSEMRKKGKIPYIEKACSVWGCLSIMSRFLLANLQNFTSDITFNGSKFIAKSEKQFLKENNENQCQTGFWNRERECSECFSCALR